MTLLDHMDSTHIIEMLKSYEEEAIKILLDHVSISKLKEMLSKENICDIKKNIINTHNN